MGAQNDSRNGLSLLRILSEVGSGAGRREGGSWPGNWFLDVDMATVYSREGVSDGLDEICLEVYLKMLFEELSYWNVVRIIC